MSIISMTKKRSNKLIPANILMIQEKSEAFLTQKEKRILERLRRAPKDAKVPDLDRIYKLELELDKGQSLEEVVEAYQSHPGVEYAELNYIVSVDLAPNDPLYPLQWSLDNTGQDYPASGKYNSPPGTADCDINAPEAWDISTGSYYRWPDCYRRNMASVCLYRSFNDRRINRRTKTPRPRHQIMLSLAKSSTK